MARFVTPTQRPAGLGIERSIQDNEQAEREARRQDSSPLPRWLSREIQLPESTTQVAAEVPNHRYGTNRPINEERNSPALSHLHFPTSSRRNAETPTLVDFMTLQHENADSNVIDLRRGVYPSVRAGENEDGLDLTLRLGTTNSEDRIDLALRLGPMRNGEGLDLALRLGPIRNEEGLDLALRLGPMRNVEGLDLALRLGPIRNEEGLDLALRLGTTFQPDHRYGNQFSAVSRRENMGSGATSSRGNHDIAPRARREQRNTLALGPHSNTANFRELPGQQNMIIIQRSCIYRISAVGTTGSCDEGLAHSRGRHYTMESTMSLEVRNSSGTTRRSAWGGYSGPL